MKRTYETPEVEVMQFETEDIILASSGDIDIPDTEF